MTEQEAIDNLMEKTFLLLGCLQDYDPEDREWKVKFVMALSHQRGALNVFRPNG